MADPRPGGRALDPHTAWVRDRILRNVTSLAGAELAALGVGAVVGLRLLGGFRLAVAGPAGAALALALVVGLLARAALTNPYSFGYLRARRRANRRLIPGRADTLAPPLGHGLTVVAAAWDRDEPPRPVVDLYRTSGGDALVARLRGEGWLSVLSRLGDGRILVTDTASPVPHSRLVINLVNDLVNDAGAPDAGEGSGLGALLARHREAVEALGRAGHRLGPADPALYLDLRAVEEVGLALLGPRLGPFFNPFPPARPLRFLAPLPPGELFGLAQGR